MSRMSIEDFEKITGKKLKPVKTIEEKLGLEKSNNKENYINKKSLKSGQEQKFNSNTCYLDGITFKSKLEMDRYTYLKLLKQLKKIKDFEYNIQRFDLIDTIDYPFLQERKFKKITYTPDFKIIDFNDNIFYEDTKSKITSKKESYTIKKRLFLQKYIIGKEKIFFKEIFLFDDNYFLI